MNQITSSSLQPTVYSLTGDSLETSRNIWKYTVIVGEPISHPAVLAWNNILPLPPSTKSVEGLITKDPVASTGRSIPIRYMNTENESVLFAMPSE